MKTDKGPDEKYDGGSLKMHQAKFAATKTKRQVDGDKMKRD